MSSELQSSRNPRTRAELRSLPWIWHYHSIGAVDYDPYGITVSPRRFAEHMEWLRRRGLRGVAARDLLAAPPRRRGKLVGLTFDGGYADFAESAVPVLERFGFGATVFVVAGCIGEANVWSRGRPKPLMSEAQLRDVASRGFEIGSQGLRHMSLLECDDAQLEEEVTRSRAALDELVEETGYEVSGFCYPYGSLSAKTAAAVVRGGYEYACSARPVLGGRHALPRTPIGQHDRAPRLWFKRRRNELWNRRWQRGAEVAPGDPTDRDDSADPR